MDPESASSPAGQGDLDNREAPQFVLMLTEADVTIPDALEVYAGLVEEDLSYVAFKDIGAEAEYLQELTDAIHADGREAIMEIADMSDEGQRVGFRLAIDLGVDTVIGAWRRDMVKALQPSNAPAYWPFVGRLLGSPLSMVSTPEELRAGATVISAAEVPGMVVMPYRQKSYDPQMLLDTVCDAGTVPVLVAGGVRTRLKSGASPGPGLGGSRWAARCFATGRATHGP